MDILLGTLKSKTFWFNFVTVIAMILATPEVSGLIPESWLKPLLAVNALGNIILRVFFTSQPVTEK